MIKKLIKKICAPILAQLNKPEYLKEIEKACRAGYNYHQKMIKGDHELKKWILQDSYFED